MSDFQLQRLGLVMESEPGNPLEVEGVLNPAAARGADAVGYEIALPMIVACLCRRRRERVRFVYKSLFSADLSEVDVVYLFGTPPALRGPLLAKLERELKPGARVISYAFAFGGWTPQAVDRPNPSALPIYLYLR